MHNREHKNWNNFALGLFVIIFPFLRLPQSFKDWLLIAVGILITIFSLANLGRNETTPTV